MASKEYKRYNREFELEAVRLAYPSGCRSSVQLSTVNQLAGGKGVGRRLPMHGKLGPWAAIHVKLFTDSAHSHPVRNRSSAQSHAGHILCVQLNHSPPQVGERNRRFQRRAEA